MSKEKDEARQNGYVDGDYEGKIKRLLVKDDDLEFDLPQSLLDFWKLNNVWHGTIEAQNKTIEFWDMLHEIDNLDFRLC